MQKQTLQILVSVLEASSSLHLKTLMKTLDSLPQCPRIVLKGIFDSAILEGLTHITGTPLYHPKDFSVMGFSAVFKKIGFLLKARNEMLGLANSADLGLFLDSSAFHIPLAKKIKTHLPNLKLFYYILPQIWAWRAYRAKTIQENFDALLAILPFELSYYQHKVHYVGHPLLDSITQFKQSPTGEGIVFMPGSRKGEISRLFPIFCSMAKKYFKEKKKILVVPQSLKNSDLSEIYGQDLSLFTISFDATEALTQGEFAFICSGTATLEAALIGIPFVLAYRTSKLDYAILSRFVKLKCIGLANIFYQALNGYAAGRGDIFLHPEILQENCNPEQLIQAYEKMDREKFFKQASLLRPYLQYGSAQNVAKWILGYQDLSFFKV